VHVANQSITIGIARRGRFAAGIGRRDSIVSLCNCHGESAGSVEYMTPDVRCSYLPGGAVFSGGMCLLDGDGDHVTACLSWPAWDGHHPLAWGLCQGIARCQGWLMGIAVGTGR